MFVNDNIEFELHNITSSMIRDRLYSSLFLRYLYLKNLNNLCDQFPKPVNAKQ